MVSAYLGTVPARALATPRLDGPAAAFPAAGVAVTEPILRAAEICVGHGSGDIVNDVTIEVRSGELAAAEAYR